MTAAYRKEVGRSRAALKRGAGATKAKQTNPETEEEERNVLKGTRFSSLRMLAVFLAFALVIAACGDDDETTATTAGGGDTPATTAAPAETYTLGVSNTLVGNGWREQMICSIKAEALASGVVDRVVVINENADTTGQIGHIESLISQGVNAIIINPTDREGLNSVIEEAISQGIVVVAVDQAVTADGAYVATNDQTLYGELGARWLFDAMGGTGNVVEMRGIDGVPADTDRHNGFLAALADYPDITISQETFTGWDPTVGAQQALDIISAGGVDGIWTSGIDYTVIDQFAAANVPFVPVVGADNNGFVDQLLNDEGVLGAAVTNPPAIGGVGAAIAIQALTGGNPAFVTTLTPEVFDNTQTADLERLFDPNQQVGWSTYVEISPYTTYVASQVSDCKGPGE